MNDKFIYGLERLTKMTACGTREQRSSQGNDDVG